MHVHGINNKPSPGITRTGCRHLTASSPSAAVSFIGVDWEVEKEKSLKRQMKKKKRLQVSIPTMVTETLTETQLLQFLDVAGQNDENALKIRNLREASIFFGSPFFQKVATATELKLEETDVDTDPGKLAALKHLVKAKEEADEKAEFSEGFYVYLQMWANMAVLANLSTTPHPIQTVLPKVSSPLSSATEEGFNETNKNPNWFSATVARFKKLLEPKPPLSWWAKQGEGFDEMYKKTVKHAYFAGMNEFTRLDEAPRAMTEILQFLEGFEEACMAARATRTDDLIEELDRVENAKEKVPVLGDGFPSDSSSSDASSTATSVKIKMERAAHDFIAVEAKALGWSPSRTNDFKKLCLK